MLGLRRRLLDPQALDELVVADGLEDVDVVFLHLIQLTLDGILTPTVNLVDVQLSANVALAVLADPLEVADNRVVQALGESVGLHGLLKEHVGLLALGLGALDALAVLQLLEGPVLHIGRLALRVVSPDSGDIPTDLALVHGGRLAALGTLSAVLVDRLIVRLRLDRGETPGVLGLAVLDILVAVGLVDGSEVVPAVPQGIGVDSRGSLLLHLIQRVLIVILLHHQLDQPVLLVLILTDSVQDVVLSHNVHTPHLI